MALSLLLLLRFDASSSVRPSAPSLPVLPAAASCCVLPPPFRASALSLLESAAAGFDVLDACVLQRQHEQDKQGSMLPQHPQTARDRSYAPFPGSCCCCCCGAASWAVFQLEPSKGVEVVAIGHPGPAAADEGPCAAADNRQVVRGTPKAEPVHTTSA